MYMYRLSFFFIHDQRMLAAPYLAAPPILGQCCVFAHAQSDYMNKTCIIPTLLYGCDMWLLDSTSLRALEGCQHEIGCRILRVPKFYSKASVRIALHWPTVATRTLIRKLNFLSKLLSGSNDTISKQVFSSLAVEDVYESSIVQQCRMLESKLDTCVLAKCLSDAENAPEAKQIFQAKKALYVPISI